MRIGNPADKPAALAPSPGHAAALEPVKAAALAAPARATPAVPDASARVELSSAASSLRSGGTTAEFDAEKVARIAQSIADGTFTANPLAIADKLIANAQELLVKGMR